MTQKAQITIYTDGGCDPNPGLGAYAAILQSQTTGKEKVITGAEADTTNYRMELMAVVVGLEALKRPATVTVVCDNNNVVKGAEEWLDGWIANEWRNSRNKPVEHADLWERIHRAMQEHEISFVKVKAHVAHNQASEAEKMNNRADTLVAQAREAYRQSAADNAADSTQTNERNYRLYIAGSRQANANMLEYARRVVARAIDNQWTIVVGDNAQGIDMEVVKEANRLNYSDVIVVGIARQPRNGGVATGKYLRIGKSYSDCDQAMARSSDRGIFIWDGSSPGTRTAADFMKSLDEKLVHVMDFANTFAQ